MSILRMLPPLRGRPLLALRIVMLHEGVIAGHQRHKQPVGDLFYGRDAKRTRP